MIVLLRVKAKMVGKLDKYEPKQKQPHDNLLWWIIHIYQTNFLKWNKLQVSLKLYNNKDYVDLSDYWKSGTWDIIEVPAFLNIYNDSRPTETDITFYITIRRKTLFYTVNLILPTVLISFLCVLVFYLPAEAGEKVWNIISYSVSQNDCLT